MNAVLTEEGIVFHTLCLWVDPPQARSSLEVYLPLAASVPPKCGNVPASMFPATPGSRVGDNVPAWAVDDFLLNHIRKPQVPETDRVKAGLLRLLTSIVTYTLG